MCIFSSECIGYWQKIPIDGAEGLTKTAAILGLIFKLSLCFYGSLCCSEDNKVNNNNHYARVNESNWHVIISNGGISDTRTQVKKKNA